MKIGFHFSREKCAVLFGACLISFVSYGLSRCSGLLFVATLSRFGGSRLMTSLPYTLQASMRNFASPLVGYLGNKFGLSFITGCGGIISMLCLAVSFFADNIIYLTLFIGIGNGIGYGFATVLLPQILTYHFKTHSDKIIGLYFSCGIIGALVLSAITELLLNKYELSGTLLVLSSIYFHITLGSLLLKKKKNNLIRKKIPNCANPASDYEFENNYKIAVVSSVLYEKDCDVIVCEDTKPQEATEQKRAVNCEKKTSSSSFLVFLDPTYIVMNMVQGLQLFVNQTFIVVLMDILLDKKLSSEESLHAFLFQLAGDIIGRLFCGFFTDRGCVSKINYATFSCLVLGISMCSLVWVNLYMIIAMLVSIMGFFFGGVTTVGVGIIAKFTETKNVRMGMASMYLSFAPLNLIAPLVIGYYRDILKSYDGLLYTLAALCLACALMNAITPAMAKRRDNKN